MITNQIKKLLYLYPPHPSPTSKVRPEDLDRHEKTGRFFAQYKFNGSRASITICSQGIQIWTRHGEPFKNIKITDEIEGLFKNLNINKEDTIVLDGEFLENKAKNKIKNEQAIKRTIVLFDILYYNQNLYNMPQLDRQNLLSKVCNNPTILEPEKRALIVSNYGEANLWLAENFFNDFAYRYYYYLDKDEHENEYHPELEGLILRTKTGKLKLGNTKYDTHEILRARKPSNRHGKF